MTTHPRPINPELQPLARHRCRQAAALVARDLLGRYLIRNHPKNRRLILKIIETEAYLGTTDRASHAFAGRKTPRTRTLHLEGGHAYIYLIYGLHHCFNVVAGNTTNGEAVLIRAGTAIEGLETMTRNRKLQPPLKPAQLAGGPGKLCQALQIDRTLDAIRLDNPAGPLYLAQGKPVLDDSQIAIGPRIGIDYAQEARAWPLRFALRSHPEMSKPILH